MDGYEKIGNEWVKKLSKENLDITFKIKEGERTKEFDELMVDLLAAANEKRKKRLQEE